ncbi:hypothetical protein GF362_00795 [Candidatus Dojkabacteria bacterium]|nr:hypothetical protein [Candidatus Dojkabacteria bacterium]
MESLTDYNPFGDYDNDGISNIEEWLGVNIEGYGHITTNWREEDTDKDGLNDGEERDLGTNPRNPDSHLSGILDGYQGGKFGEIDIDKYNQFTQITIEGQTYSEFAAELISEESLNSPLHLSRSDSGIESGIQTIDPVACIANNGFTDLWEIWANQDGGRYIDKFDFNGDGEVTIEDLFTDY